MRSLLLDGCSPGGVEARTDVELRQARVAAFEKRILSNLDYICIKSLNARFE